MISVKMRVVLLVFAAVLILAVLREESINAFSIAWPMCVFTFVGGAWLTFRSKDILRQLIGMAMILSPLYLIPLCNNLIDLLGGML
ncbi:MAG: hypothetical protein FWG19_00100 [Methanomassiliicoccaceae archaeon]|nr:hypothetical protein [Methanomassiliicoccaceae archaeon]